MYHLVLFFLQIQWNNFSKFFNNSEWPQNKEKISNSVSLYLVENGNLKCMWLHFLLYFFLTTFFSWICFSFNRKLFNIKSFSSLPQNSQRKIWPCKTINKAYLYIISLSQICGTISLMTQRSPFILRSNDYSRALWGFTASTVREGCLGYRTRLDRCFSLVTVSCLIA